MHALTGGILTNMQASCTTSLSLSLEFLESFEESKATEQVNVHPLAHTSWSIFDYFILI